MTLYPASRPATCGPGGQGVPWGRDRMVERQDRRLAGVTGPRRSEIAVATFVALVAFAANSILTRLALGARAMDAATFTTVRIATGAIVLAGLARGQTGDWSALRGGARDLVAPVALFAYVALFSFAYVRIGAAVGALLL